jgi:hypothetical protein
MEDHEDDNNEGSASNRTTSWRDPRYLVPLIAAIVPAIAAIIEQVFK